MGKLGWLAAFIYTAAVALRLARFNTQLEVADKRYFQGLNCPSAAAVLCSFVWVCIQNDVTSSAVIVMAIALAVLTAVLMVSNIRYHSFKELDFKGKIPFLYVLLVVILFVAVAAYPSLVLLLASLGYALSGPIQTLLSLHKMRKKRHVVGKRKTKKA